MLLVVGYRGLAGDRGDRGDTGDMEASNKLDKMGSGHISAPLVQSPVNHKDKSWLTFW